jgi:hypothetical protein
MSFEDIITSWQFYVTTAVVLGLTQAISRVLWIRFPTTADHKAIRAGERLGTLFWGGVAGAIPGFLPGDNLGIRIVIGMLAGFLAPSTWSVMKSVFPQLDSERATHQSNGTPAPGNGDKPSNPPSAL